MGGIVTHTRPPFKRVNPTPDIYRMTPGYLGEGPLMKGIVMMVFALGLYGLAAPAGTAAQNVSAGPLWGSLDQIDWKASAALPLGAEYHILREDAQSGGIQALVRFRPGYALPEHAHEFDETLVVLRGKVWLRCADFTKVLSAGDYVALPLGTRHEFKAQGRKELVMLLTTHGPFSLQQ